ncbi:MAG: DUF4139 domain-containing protein [Phycisphaerae bacterium]|nr:DUF4139 domain-containing protein [Phycisphaerae bacterium]MDD5380344.1 DUF4139 domain-containing protein [Phycisphaerae bacterium]
MKKRIIFSAIALIMVYSAGFAAPQKANEQGTALTIYNDNFAVVRESRQMSFEKGLNTAKFTDVASAIDPTSVNFRCLSAPGAVSVLEQNYEYDLVNTDSLLKRYIDKNVTAVLKGSGADPGRKSTGQLLASMGDSLILKSQANDIEILDKSSIEEISLKEMPDDLVTRPTLVWLANAKEKGDQLCQVTYTTGQINWNADYSAVLNADETKIDFTGWVTIDNKSGATYKDSTIKLIAGDVRRVAEPQRPRGDMVFKMAAEAAGGGFEEKPFMEYHMYTLGRKSTINNNQVKQVEFITPALGVPVKKLYIYERGGQQMYGRGQQSSKVQIKLEFENKKENNLGIALPKGKVRVFKKDPADESLEFVGEDRIDHTPNKEKLLLYIGNAFDVVAEYTQVDSQHDRRMTRETHKIELRNRKAEPITVFVDEKFPQWVNWTIDKNTHNYEKRDANTARFEVKIEADSTATLQYTATQTW